MVIVLVFVIVKVKLFFRFEEPGCLGIFTCSVIIVSLL